MGRSAILFSSDVSARGMDYPDVSFVLQVGLPSDKAQYIHRLGRTARSGKGGSGLLILCDFEQYFLKEVTDLALKENPPIPKSDFDAMWFSTEKALDRAHQTNPLV